MALYKNKRTGAVIDIPGVITGDVWEKVEEKAKPKSEPAKVEPKAEAPTIKAPKKKRSNKK